MLKLDRRTKSLLHNIGWTSVIRMASVLTNLISIPLIVNILGTNDFGVWTTISSLLAWINFFDFGTTLSLQNRITNTITKHKIKETKILISSTYALIFLVMMLFLLIVIPASFYINWNMFLNTHTIDNITLRNVIIIVSTSISLQLVLKLSTAVLFAYQKTYQIEIISLLTQILTLISLFAIKNIPIFPDKLVIVALLSTSIPITIYLACNFYLFRFKYRVISPSINFIKRNIFKIIAKNSGHFFILQVYGFILFQTDNIITSYILGPESVTTLNLATKYFSIITITFGFVLLPFWAACSEAFALNDFLWVRKILNKNLILIVLALVVSFAMIPFTKDVIFLWTKQELAIPTKLSIFLAIYTVILSYNNIFGIILNSANLFRVQIFSAITVIIINIPLSFLLTKNFNLGLPGIVLSNIICVAIFGFFITVEAFKLLYSTKTTG